MKHTFASFTACALALALVVSAAVFAQEKSRKPGTYAIFDTSMGIFVCELYEKVTPVTVANFIGLAEGTKEWLSPKGDMMKNTRYYDGVTFHRVIKGFMIQTGDITGSGSFRPVVPFEDEIVPTLRFNRSGVLAMANSGPNTNGSQFFITVAPATHLDQKHTIFGRVVEGYEVVEKISQAPVGLGSKPQQPIAIRKLAIERVAKPQKK